MQARRGLRAHYMAETEDIGRGYSRGVAGAGTARRDLAVVENRGAFDNSGAAWASGLRADSRDNQFTEHEAFGPSAIVLRLQKRREQE